MTTALQVLFVAGSAVVLLVVLWWLAGGLLERWTRSPAVARICACGRWAIPRGPFDAGGFRHAEHLCQPLRETVDW